MAMDTIAAGTRVLQVQAQSGMEAIAATPSAPGIAAQASAETNATQMQGWQAERADDEWQRPSTRCGTARPPDAPGVPGGDGWLRRPPRASPRTGPIGADRAGGEPGPGEPRPDRASRRLQDHRRLPQAPDGLLYLLAEPPPSRDATPATRVVGRHQRAGLPSSSPAPPRGPPPAVRALTIDACTASGACFAMVRDRLARGLRASVGHPASLHPRASASSRVST